jgi:predicted glycogen debranching enzyme
MTQIETLPSDISTVRSEEEQPRQQSRPLGNKRAPERIQVSRNIEWLETDGLGGFASGTTAGIRTRRYHALLLTATNPPTGRVVLVNGFEAWAETPAGTFPITSQHYSPDIVHPDGAQRIESFEAEPWPKWTFRLDNGTRIEQEIFAVKGAPVIALRWRVVERGRSAKKRKVTLVVRPLLSGRDYHQLHRANPAFGFKTDGEGERLTWNPHHGIPGVVSIANGQYTAQPDWYRNFLYEQERGRGLDHAEDLATPGFYRWDLSQDDAVWILTTDPETGRGLPVTRFYDQLRNAELERRKSFPTRLHRAADDYIVRRGQGKTIVAGYPWFTDWGRDTFIALRGICLAAGRVDEARDILVEWAGAVSEGMLPNRFPDHGEQPEFNSVDASLWYIIAVHDYLRATGRKEPKLCEAVNAILTGYAKGTRFNIHADTDGLLVAGQPGVQLTWMDAKVGDWVVTPRIGKPVEIEALWLNALRIGGDQWGELYRRGLENFRAKFWNAEGGYLHDVIDPVDTTFRPNQIFAIGGLPFPLLEGKQARLVVEAVEQRLLTPLGLRSLAPGERDYRPRYEGGVWERDGAYHQGTVWPWLLGPFVEAWVRVRGNTTAAKREARARFIEPVQQHLNRAGLGHVSEIADADAPHTPRGCPWQAWSAGEMLRLDLDILAEIKQPERRRK